MNAHLIDRLARSVARSGSRRGLLRGAALAAVAAAAGLVHTPATATGCAKVGKRCKRADQCCSGICHGKHGKKKCRAHGTGTCQRGQDRCTDPFPEIDTCNNNANCGCIRTTADSSFCYDLAAGGTDCAPCERDADCLTLGFPPGSACGPTSAGRCAGLCESGTACLVPCGAATPTNAGDRRSRRGSSPRGG